MKIRMSKDERNRIAHDVAVKEYTVDAKGRPLGRVASEAAAILLGKKSTSFVKNKVIPVQVTIVNAKKLAIREKMLKEKTYRRYTGYPGGLREANLGEIVEKKGIAEIIRMAVDGMIPRNKLRKERMKRLTITD